ncbi:MAG TPA: prolyl oligopeptidase family serine peptidase [Acidimicrobiales bacterium]|nr:prolyl oligopeptidase family serine peptidase [Acidimicrobiales bacterium]
MKVGPSPAAEARPVVDTIHGVEVADPYRWLEDGEAADTLAWTLAQNRRTREALDGLPDRPELRRRMERLLRATLVTSPKLRGERVFTLERGGERDQAVLVVRSADDPSAPARTLVDPARSAADAAVALDWFHPSPKGSLVAYGTSEAGDERSTLRVLDVDTATHRGDVIAHTRAASVAWLPDGSAFAYTRYPDPAAAGDEEAGYHRSVWWHVLGDDPGHDELVWGDADMPDRTAWPDVSLSPDGRWLLIHVALGWSRTDVHLIDRDSGERTTLIEGEEAQTSLEVVDDRLYGITTLGAPRGRVVTAHLAAPDAPQWETLVAETDAVIEGAAVAGASLLVASSRVAVASLHRVRLDGSGEHAVELPGIGALSGLDADPGVERAFLSFGSFTRPPQLFRWAPEGLEPWSDASPAPDERYLVEQVAYPSTDGIDVPMFLVRRSDTTPDPDTPVVLTGYGGFAIANGPAWSPMAVAVADAGAIHAVACIRGGAEHGEDWHRAGMREHKQQSFDDFLAAADWLVAEGLTSRPRLAIRGGSNGGLLMGAALTQRPELCRAVHCAVPLLDMVRYPRFLIARLWALEYGDPDVAKEFAWLHAWSPYHRLVDGTCYPAVLLTTAESDSRVDPCHARKFAARLQAATSCGDDHPVLLRVEERAGHGQGKPVGKQADEAADVLAFLFDQLGVAVARSS